RVDRRLGRVGVRLVHQRAGPLDLRILRIARAGVLIAADVATDAVFAAPFVLHHALAGIVDFEDGRLDPSLGGLVVFLGVRRLERGARSGVLPLPDLLEQELAGLPLGL